MPSWSTHKIELLIKDIDEMQCFWNMFNPEYKERIKKSDAWQKVSEVLDRNQMEITLFFSRFSYN